MGKKYSFTSNQPLKLEHFKSFLQDSQILQSKGYSETDVMSQKAVSYLVEQSGYEIYKYAGAVHHATGKFDNNVLIVCADNPIVRINAGTTIIVNISESFTYVHDYAKLKVNNTTYNIVVPALNGAKRKIYYSADAVAYTSTDIHARNVFLKGANYEFYFDGANWILKNNVVENGANYRIWADGLAEQWGEVYVSPRTKSNINFAIPYAGSDYNVMLSGRKTVSSLTGAGNSPAIGLSYKSKSYMTVYEDLNGAYVSWHVKGY